MSKPRILFMGTPAFAVPALEGLVRNGYPIVSVVTQPDRPQGRGRSTAPSPIKLVAEGLGLPVLQPERVRDPSFLETYRQLAPDLCVVAAFGQILPAVILHGPPHGCINIHPSLLPQHRGAAPINWALIRGEQRTGVTIMQMDEGVDSGAILLQEETPIGDQETFGELHDRLATMGAELLLICLAMLHTGTLRPRPQEHPLATFAPRIKRDDGLIRWENDGRTIVSLIRGLSPQPCAFTYLDGKLLKIYRAMFVPGTVAEAPGTVTGVSAAGLCTAAGEGYVLLQEMQLEGKKRLACRDFLCGIRSTEGLVLGS